MAREIKARAHVDVTVDPQKLATWFAEMDDDAQAEFFEAVADRFAEWGQMKRDTQAILLGRHLVDCECTDGKGGYQLLKLMVECADERLCQIASPVTPDAES